jgi:hypothetical protein
MWFPGCADGKLTFINGSTAVRIDLPQSSRDIQSRYSTGFVSGNDSRKVHAPRIVHAAMVRNPIESPQ